MLVLIEIFYQVLPETDLKHWLGVQALDFLISRQAAKIDEQLLVPTGFVDDCSLEELCPIG